MENHHVQWVNPLEMAIFNSYVKLPEGTLILVTSNLKLTTFTKAPAEIDVAMSRWHHPLPVNHPSSKV